MAGDEDAGGRRHQHDGSDDGDVATADDRASRDGVAESADAAAGERDQTAASLDAAANVRDEEAAERDRLAAARDKAPYDPAEAAARLSSDRRQAAWDRGDSAADRASALDDRGRARRDRKSALHDRERSARDRAVAAEALARFKLLVSKAEGNSEDMLLIGQAQGILMDSRGLNAADALLELLAQAARDHAELRDVAARIAAAPRGQ